MTEALVEHKGAADEAFVQIAQIPRISIQAFCESPAIAQVVEQAAADRRMAKAQVKVNMGGVAAAIEAFRSAPTPNLIVVEFDERARGAHGEPRYARRVLRFGHQGSRHRA